MAVKVHHKQWIITRKSTLPIVTPEFRTLALEPGIYLHYETSLAIRRIKNDSSDALILGVLVGDDPDRACGRFVAIRTPWLSLDATGSMGVFYFKQPCDVICSSSTSLIQAVTGANLIGRELRWSKGMNWDPPPAARISGVRKLFCDQAIDITTGLLAHRPVNLEKAFLAVPNSVARALARYLEFTVKEVTKLDRPIFVGLTAGRDSRTVFSALLKAEVPFEAFTLHRGKGTSIDAEVAATLCRRFSIQHHLLTPSVNVHVDDLEKLNHHTAGAEADAGQEYALRDYYRNLPNNAIVLHGGVFELGRRYYEKRLSGINFSSSRDAAEGIAAAFVESSRTVLAPLRTWNRYRRKHPIYGMDFIDMFYLDQRRGGWGAANQQAQDAFGPEQLIVANSWEAIELLMAPSLELRRKAIAQMAATELLVPGITSIVPINPLTLTDKVRGTLVRAVSWSPTTTRLLKVLRRRLHKGLSIKT